MTTKKAKHVLTIGKADYTEEHRLPITLKGAKAEAAIGEGQKVTVEITQALIEPDERAPMVRGPRAFVKWLENDVDDRVDLCIHIGREHEMILTTVYASDVRTIADAILAALAEAERRGIVQVGEGDRITTKAVRRNGKAVSRG